MWKRLTVAGLIALSLVQPQMAQAGGGSTTFTSDLGALDFGAVTPGGSASLTVHVTFSGMGLQGIGAVTLQGATSSDFQIAYDSCSGAQVGAGGGASCAVTVRLTPTGTASASLVIPPVGGAGFVASALLVPVSGVLDSNSSGGNATGGTSSSGFSSGACVPDAIKNKFCIRARF